MSNIQTITVALALLLGGCADDSAGKASFDESNNASNANPGAGGGGGGVEVEQEFEFAQPAVLGTDVFVANESLNTVAVIDSRSLAIRTIPVGFRPTRVVGPSEPTADARVYVLNEGSSTVSIVVPDSLAVKNVNVLRRANALATSADGSWALAWFDEAELAPDASAGDLSAATLIQGDGRTFQLAVGFRIEKVLFTADSALLLSDDGISVVRPADINADMLVAPVSLLPPDLQTFDRTDREVVLDPNGEWAIARITTFAGIILTELETGVQWRVPLQAAPSDIDWVPGATPRILGMIRSANVAFVSTVPEGLIALSAVVPPASDMGPDMGAADMGAADMGAADIGAADLGPANDMGPDAGSSDVGADVPDVPPTPQLPTMPVDGFWYLPLDLPNLGAAEVSPNAANALLFSTIGEERRGILLDLATLEQRGLAFEKGVRGAIANDLGTTFVVLHTREEGGVAAGASPSDPEFILRSWGLSIVDVASTATRLVLTERQPGKAALWNGETSERLFMIFENDASNAASLRDVLRIDLVSFSTDTFRVPSLPEGVGRIDSAGRIYVNQLHPQGRITFVDVASDRRQTITGYQLNSGID